MRNLLLAALLWIAAAPALAATCTARWTHDGLGVDGAPFAVEEWKIYTGTDPAAMTLTDTITDPSDTAYTFDCTVLHWVAVTAAGANSESGFSNFVLLNAPTPPTVTILVRVINE